MDCDKLLLDAPRLIQSIVDVISSNGWLKPALAVMELCQSVVQGLWNDDSPLLQLPHFTKELVEELSSATVKKANEDGDIEESAVESVYDVIDLEPTVRESLLGLTKSQVQWCSGVL